MMAHFSAKNEMANYLAPNTDNQTSAKISVSDTFPPYKLSTAKKLGEFKEKTILRQSKEYV